MLIMGVVVLILICNKYVINLYLYLFYGSFFQSIVRCVCVCACARGVERILLIVLAQRGLSLLCEWECYLNFVWKELSQ